MLGVDVKSYTMIQVDLKLDLMSIVNALKNEYVQVFGELYYTPVDQLIHAIPDTTTTFRLKKVHDEDYPS